MSKVKIIYLLILILTLSLWGATYRVSKSGSGQFTSIQAAVDVAGPGDIIEVIDYSIYEEQVSIDSTKNGLTLRSSNPTSPNKPTIKYQDRDNVNPKTYQESQNPDMINFDRNGALRVLGAVNVTVEGVVVDGSGHYTFCWPNIWEGQYDLFHGNAAIVLWVCGYTNIRNCDIKNAHFGIAVKDRNEGGIFANANPADVQPWLVVPLSRYGKVGGHIIEQNRVHDNVYGFFNESAWDMGSTIRYNLIYENHYVADEAATVYSMYNEGQKHPGGAFEFKDNALTPWAIYNNTFWHNFTTFIGHWQAGPQHLIFNNIYGELNDGKGMKTWDRTMYYRNECQVQSMDKAFVNRMKYSVYDLMQEPPQMQPRQEHFGCQDPGTGQYVSVNKTVDVCNRIIIQNQMDVERSDLIVSCTLSLSTGDTVLFKVIPNAAVEPGAWVQPFPRSAGVGYYPVTFKSTDPASSDFLAPDWGDTVVQRLILDQGWPEAGITDADGSPADLGAIPQGGIPGDRASIVSLAPVAVSGGEAILSFNLNPLGTSFASPKMAYIKLIDPLEFNVDSWGGAANPVASGAIKSVTINSGLPLKIGQNTLKADLPSGFTADYAFYELFIEGTGSQGKQVASSAGFLPYRKLDYYFEVWVMDLAKVDTLDSVYAGDTVLLCIEAYNQDGSKFTNDIDSAQVDLMSGFDLHSQNYPDVISGKLLQGGIPKGYRETQVMFTKVPQPQGLEYVQATGLWSSGTQQMAFYGISDGIRILPGPAAAVLFQDPPSRTYGAAPTVIDPGINYPGYLEVFDKFENLIDESVPIPLSVENNNTNGIIVGANPINTNNAGRGDFTIQVKGNEGDIVTFIAALNSMVSGMVYDSADVKVGKQRNQLWIFYTGAGEVIPDYDSTNILRGYPNERLKSTIAVIKDSNNTYTLVPSSEKITVKPMGTDPVKFYSSQTAPTEQSEFTLVDGKVDVWVTSSDPNLITGPGYGMTTYPSDPASLIAVTEKSTRYKLYFIKPLVPPCKRAAYYDNNGDGFVDLVNITYDDTLGDKPDSVYLFWPDKATEKKAILKDNTGMTLSADKKTLTISINPPFSSVQTSGDGKGQSWHQVYQGQSEPTPEFDILDSVGPRLLNRAYLYERFDPGNDTLVLELSEDIRAADVTQAAGVSFILIKPSGEVNLTILDNAGNGDLSNITIAIPDLGTYAPAAGDSIKIYAQGPVKDVLNNKAHECNPPVPIVIRAKPVPIDTATYWDLDANGIVELLRIKLKKKITIGAIEKVDVTFGSDNATADATDIYYFNNDSTTIQIMLTDIYNTSVLESHGTGGAMTAAITYNGVSGTESGSAIDKAAPVIASAHYIAGDFISGTTEREPDEIEVTFTEDVESNSHNEPFLFLNTPTQTIYQILMKSSSYSDNVAAVVVDTIIGRRYPSNGDSIWINTVAGIEDGLNNVQDNGKNKKVPMEVDPEPYNLIIKAVTPVVPKEYSFSSKILSRLVESISFNTGVYIRIDPQTESDEGHILRSASIKILDAVGNCIASCNDIGDDNGILVIQRDNQDEKLHVFWSGQNENRRYVGHAVYVCIIEVTDKDGIKVKKKISIGVREAS